MRLERAAQLLQAGAEGEAFIKAIVGPGQMLGEQSVMGAVSYGEVAEVQLDGSLFVLRWSDLQDLMASNLAFSLSLFRTMGALA